MGIPMVNRFLKTRTFDSTVKNVQDLLAQKGCFKNSHGHDKEICSIYS